MGDYELNLDDIDDELELHKLVDQTDDIDERKAIRARLKEVMAQHRAEREERLQRREQDRENLLRKKVADADEQKRRTLAMYDAMAKSAPAGGHKSIDVGILRTGVPTNQLDPHKDTPKLDLVEEAIRERQKSSDDNKKKVLAAFDKAARSGPAGTTKLVDFDNVTSEDISHIENKHKAPKYTSTFEMRGGVPNAAKVVAPRPMPRQVEPEHDILEEAIRKRQAEADERKRRTLEVYAQAAKSRPAGAPINVYIPQSFDIEPVISFADRPKDSSSQLIMSSVKQPSSNGVPNSPRPVKQPPQPPPKPVVSQFTNIKTQSVRTVNNPYEQPKPVSRQQQQQYQQQQNVTRTTTSTQKTTGPVTTQQNQSKMTITTQSVQTMQKQQQQRVPVQQQRVPVQQQQYQQQQQQQQQQQYYDDDEEEEEDEDDDYE